MLQSLRSGSILASKWGAVAALEKEFRTNSLYPLNWSQVQWRRLSRVVREAKSRSVICLSDCRDTVAVMEDSGMGDSSARGILYAILSAISLAVTPVVSKYALRAMNAQSFAAYWALAVFVLTSGYWSCFRRDRVSLRLRKEWKGVLPIALLFTVSLFAWTKAVQIADPTVVAFFSQASMIYSVGLGVILLRERPGPMEIAGIVLTMAGILIITYRAGALVLLALAATMIHSLTTSLRGLLAKVALGRVDPITLLVLSHRLIVVFAMLFALVTRSVRSLSVVDAFLILLAAFFGAIGRFFSFKSLSAVELSKFGVIRATVPLFVALYSFVFLQVPPTGQQMVGGMVVVVGIVVLSWTPSISQLS